jgi:hypothetical protein
VRGSTYRRGIYLLLGGVILLPYALLAVVFVQTLTTPAGARGVTVLLLVATVAIAGVPAFLQGTRALEIVAVRGLLGVDLPDPAPSGGAPPAGRETRVRSALWFALHLVTGGLVALPMALAYLAQPFGISAEAFRALRPGPFDEHETLWLSLVGVALLAGLMYAVAGLGALAAMMAPVLLGPSRPSATGTIWTLCAARWRPLRRLAAARWRSSPGPGATISPPARQHPAHPSVTHRSSTRGSLHNMSPLCWTPPPHESRPE